jgi:hypothetical protein
VRLPDGRVGKEYVGCGPAAEQIAKADAEARARREADRTEARRAQSVLEPLDDLAAELDRGVNLLATATLLAGGLHQHKGTWRKRRLGLDARS